VRRLIFTPRWILWHLLTLGAMITCGFLAAWQWHRAGEAMGSALNIGYGLQWPLFAIFFGAMWWRMLRMEAAQPAEEPQEAEPAPRPAPAPRPEGPSPFGPRPLDATQPFDEDDPEDRRLAAYNLKLAEITAHDAADERN
jgi:DNA-binding transcriptional regulator of glucitol operon